MGISLSKPLAFKDTITAVANEIRANTQFSSAIFTPVPANVIPIRIMTGPITTGGKIR